MKHSMERVLKLFVAAGAVLFLAVSAAPARAQEPTFQATFAGVFEMEDMYYTSPVVTQLSSDFGSLLLVADFVDPQANLGCLLSGTGTLSGGLGQIAMAWKGTMSAPDVFGIVYFDGEFAPIDDSGVLQEYGWFGSLSGQIDSTTGAMTLTVYGHQVLPDEEG